MGFNFIGKDIMVGLIVLIYDITTILYAIRTLLLIIQTSCHISYLSVIIFEKSKIKTVKETVKKIINQKYEDPNVAKHTDCIIDAFNIKK